MVQLLRTSAVFSGSSSSGFTSDPGIAASQNNWGQGAEPGYTNWSGLDTSGVPKL